MEFGCCAFDGEFDRGASLPSGSKATLQQTIFADDFTLDQFCEAREFAFMLKNGILKFHSKGQIIDQAFEGGRSTGVRKIGVHPAPVRAMTVATVVTLHAEAERLSSKSVSIELNFPAEGGIGMRRARKADQT